MPGTSVVIVDGNDPGRQVELDSQGNLPVHIRTSGDYLGRVSLRAPGEGMDVEVDPLGGLVIIPFEHHMIHEGNYFTISDYSGDVAINSTTARWLIKTPDTVKRIHLTTMFDSSGAATVELYENPTVVANGVAMTPVNNDRNSAKTTTALVYRRPQTNGDGTLLEKRFMGANNNKTKLGGSARTAAEFILKQNEDYMLKYTPSGDNAIVATNIEFYEA